MYALTAATGRLGRLVLDTLLDRVDPSEVVALVRNPSKLTDYAARGVTVRSFDYDAPATLTAALAGIDRLLLISASEVGRREAQHRAVIDAAKAAGVSFLAYTSVLHADDNPIRLAQEHRATEAAIKANGIDYAILRHGWYTENHLASANADIERGAVVGSAGSGRLSTATRADYAAGDAAILLDKTVANATFEFAGDGGFTLEEFAAELANTSGKTVEYRDLPQADYRSFLERTGLPPRAAAMLSEASAVSAADVMFDQSGTLSRLIGRPTTSMQASVRGTIGGRGTSMSDFHQ